MRFALYDHAGKGAYLAHRLEEAGHTRAERIDETDLLLLDCDWPWAHQRPAMIAAAKKHGAKVALYPHGGMPTVFAYDGLADPNPDVDMRLEHGRGSIDLAHLFGADAHLKQHAPGWLFSPTAPFAPRKDPGRVLFAPMHPNIEAMQNGTNGHDPAPWLNAHVYRQLLDMRVELAVSLVGPAWKNGVWRHPHAAFVENHAMRFEESVALVAAADTVVAAGTLGALAVALGKPTVMFGQGDFSDYVGGQYVKAKHAGLYTAAARYPLDAEDGPLGELLARACAGDGGAADWRQAFAPDDGTEAAIRLLENLPTPLPKQAKSKGMGKKTKNQKHAEAQATAEQSQDSQTQKNVTIGGVTAKLGVNA